MKMDIIAVYVEIERDSKAFTRIDEYCKMTLNVQIIILSRQHLQVTKIKHHNHGTKKILIIA